MFDQLKFLWDFVTGKKYKLKLIFRLNNSQNVFFHFSVIARHRFSNHKHCMHACMCVCVCVCMWVCIKEG